MVGESQRIMIVQYIYLIGQLLFQEMCQDDYEYKHYSSIKDKICRRFIFINEDDDHRVYLVNIGQFQQNGKIALCKILCYLSKKGLDTENYIYYLPKFNVLLDGQQPCYTDLETLKDKEIKFQMIPRNKHEQGVYQYQQHQQQHLQQEKKKAVQPQAQKSGQTCIICQTKNQTPNYQPCINPPIKKIDKKQNQHSNNHIGSADSESLSDPSSIHLNSSTPERDANHKRMKQPERVIGDVILAVKKWRMLHEVQHMSLMNAAKIVGISKKSLDDYFLVLRMGQLCGFDYPCNLQQKMGDLRHFIRNKDCKSEGRLPKQLNQFKLFECVKNPFQQADMDIQ